MRQAVVNLGPDLLAERGLELEVFRAAGVIDAALLSCEGPRGVLRIRVAEPLDTDRLDAMDAVEWWEAVWSGRSGHVYLVEVCDTAATAETAATGDRFPHCEQLRVTDGGLRVTWAGPEDRLHEELARLDEVGSGASLEQLRSYRPQAAPLDALTDRQRAVLETAFERGYYNVPRQASVAAIADSFGLDDSTVAEHLRRAERNLLRTLFGSAR